MFVELFKKLNQSNITNDNILQNLIIKRFFNDESINHDYYVISIIGSDYSGGKHTSIWFSQYYEVTGLGSTPFFCNINCNFTKSLAMSVKLDLFSFQSLSANAAALIHKLFSRVF